MRAHGSTEIFTTFFGHSRCKSDLVAFIRNLDIEGAAAARHEILDDERITLAL